MRLKKLEYFLNRTDRFDLAGLMRHPAGMLSHSLRRASDLYTRIVEIKKKEKLNRMQTPVETCVPRSFSPP